MKTGSSHDSQNVLFDLRQEEQSAHLTFQVYKVPLEMMEENISLQ